MSDSSATTLANLPPIVRVGCAGLPDGVSRAAYHERLDYLEVPGTFFDQGYAATLAALNAVQAARGTGYEALLKALRSNPVETTLGKIKFDARGDAEGVGFSVYQVKNGAFVEVR